MVFQAYNYYSMKGIKYFRLFLLIIIGHLRKHENSFPLILEK
jgi:hypothetical protein